MMRGSGSATRRVAAGPGEIAFSSSLSTAGGGGSAGALSRETCDAERGAGGGDTIVGGALDGALAAITDPAAGVCAASNDGSGDTNVGSGDTTVGAALANVGPLAYAVGAVAGPLAKLGTAVGALAAFGTAAGDAARGAAGDAARGAALPAAGAAASGAAAGAPSGAALPAAGAAGTGGGFVGRARGAGGAAGRFGSWMPVGGALRPLRGGNGGRRRPHAWHTASSSAFSALQNGQNLIGQHPAACGRGRTRCCHRRW
jgi:hypothetical protein